MDRRPPVGDRSWPAQEASAWGVCQIGPSNKPFPNRPLRPPLGSKTHVTLTLLASCLLRSPRDKRFRAPSRPAAGGCGNKKPPSVVLPTSSVTVPFFPAHPPTRGSPQAASRGCCLTAHWRAAAGPGRDTLQAWVAEGCQALLCWAQGHGPGGPAGPGAQVPEAEPKASEAGPRMTEGGTRDRRWGQRRGRERPGRCGAQVGRARGTVTHPGGVRPTLRGRAHTTSVSCSCRDRAARSPLPTAPLALANRLSGLYRSWPIATPSPAPPPPPLQAALTIHVAHWPSRADALPAFSLSGAGRQDETRRAPERGRDQ